MKRFLLATAALLSVATSANALEVTGGDISLGYQEWSVLPMKTHTGSARAQFALGGDRFAILGASIWNYVGSGWTGAVQEIEGHVGSRLANGTAIAGFLTYESWYSGTYKYATLGVEAARGFGKLQLEGFASGEYTVGTGFTNAYLGADALYAVNDAVTMGLRTTLYGNGGNFTVYPRLLARYRMPSGLYAEASYTPAQFVGGINDQSVGLKIGYQFGTGTTFSSHDWSTRTAGDY